MGLYEQISVQRRLSIHFHISDSIHSLFSKWANCQIDSLLKNHYCWVPPYCFWAYLLVGNHLQNIQRKFDQKIVQVLVVSVPISFFFILSLNWLWSSSYDMVWIYSKVNFYVIGTIWLRFFRFLMLTWWLSTYGFSSPFSVFYLTSFPVVFYVFI